jgi:hypothetical protein
MKLREHAGTVWRKHRSPLHRIAADEKQPSRLLLGGGSILAGEWNHRESVDIDVLLPGRRTVDELGPGRRLDLAAATGGRITRQTRYRITAYTPEGVVDVAAMKPEFEGCERRLEVDGAPETVLSIAQILRGKLARIDKALPRDAFDLLTAAKAAPDALEIAVNALSADQRQAAREHLRNGNTAIGEAAGEALAAVADRYRTPADTMGRDAAEAIRRHEYTRVQIYITATGIAIVTVARHGRPRTRSYENPDPAEVLRVSGIGEYLDANATSSGYEVEKTLEGMRENRTEGLIVEIGRDTTEGEIVVRGQGGPAGGTQPPKIGERDPAPPGSDNGVPCRLRDGGTG